MKQIVGYILILSLSLFGAIMEVTDSTAAQEIETITEPLYNPFVERYLLGEVKEIRENQIRLKSEVREMIAELEISNADRNVNYATSTVANMFYVIAAAASIFVLVGWNSVRDVKSKIDEIVDAKINDITSDYETRLNALDKRLKTRTEEIINAHEEIAKANTIHSLWMRSALDITPQAKIESFDEILKVSPSDVEALSYKADALLELNEPQWALDLCNKALNIDSEYAFAYWQRACAEATLEKPQEAVSDIRKALFLSSDLSMELSTEESFNSLRNEKLFIDLMAEQTA